MSYIKLAVISDLHCMHSSKEALGAKSTYLYSDDFGVSEIRHPVKALLKRIEESSLSSELLMCPGDIADKADRQGLITGWSYLHKIQAKLNAKQLIATIGNHDVDSRNSSLGNIFSELQFFDEHYPIPDIAKDQSFWKYGFSIIESGAALILNLNTCFFHGNAETAKKSKIETYQLEAIEKELAGRKMHQFHFKIVLCHHHPILHANMDYDDNDKVGRGDELIALCDKYQFQIIIHGHKHDPRLSKFNKMPVFCAGSFSSLMNVIDLKADNMFHIITLEEKSSRGFIESWIYTPRDGWVTRYDTRFPCYTGFGFQGNLELIAKEIDDWIRAEANGTQYYSKLLDNFGDLKYLNVDEQLQLSEILKSQFQIELHPSYPNMPKIISLLVQ